MINNGGHLVISRKPSLNFWASVELASTYESLKADRYSLLSRGMRFLLDGRYLHLRAQVPKVVIAYTNSDLF